MEVDRKSVWAAVSAITAVLALAWTVVSAPRTEPPQIYLTLLDPAGSPALDVLLVLVDGETLKPDLNGLVVVAATRAGQTASVRQSSTRRELCGLTIPAARNSSIKITVADQKGARVADGDRTAPEGHPRGWAISGRRCSERRHLPIHPQPHSRRHCRSSSVDAAEASCRCHEADCFGRSF